VVSSITGTALMYGSGAGGAGFSNRGLSQPGAGTSAPFVVGSTLQGFGENGLPNRGGGGGATTNTLGTTFNGAPVRPGDGGSGFVCIRYPNIHTLPSALTGTYTIQTVGTDIVIAFTASGSVVF
jgi:hypothetical protein